MAIDFLYQELPTQWNLAPPVRQPHPLLNRVEAGERGWRRERWPYWQSSATVLNVLPGNLLEMQNPLPHPVSPGDLGVGQKV